MTGPVLADGVIYFAAGLWPTEGVFVHAVDGVSGKAVWANTDSDWIPNPGRGGGLPKGCWWGPASANTSSRG